MFCRGDGRIVNRRAAPRLSPFDGSLVPAELSLHVFVTDSFAARKPLPRCCAPRNLLGFSSPALIIQVDFVGRCAENFGIILFIITRHVLSLFY